MNYIQKLIYRKLNISYSQCGEDLITNFIFDTLNVLSPSYLDIGANHPIKLNNTYRFYKKGIRGVCIEPDPKAFMKLKAKRKKDVCLNIGIGVTREKKADFYVMSPSVLSTFSRQEAKRYETYESNKLIEVIQIPLVPINDIIKEYFPSCPDFISLDAEGMDLQILESFDFLKYKPLVFCIETLTYGLGHTERKVMEINDIMNGNGYMTYADTYINTVFVDEDRWKKRR